MTNLERKLNQIKLWVHTVQLAKEKKPKELYLQERWIAEEDDKACPVCRFLDGLGWVSFGALPDYRTAHEVLGGPNWKASNSSCRCGIDYQRGVNEVPQTLEDTKQLWYITYANLSKEEKEIPLCRCNKK